MPKAKKETKDASIKDAPKVKASDPAKAAKPNREPKVIDMGNGTKRILY